MGSLIGHVLPGVAFFALGLWHLFNHIKLHALHPNSYISSPWFPTSKIRYIELILIIVGSSISISMELFIGPRRHQPFDPDGTIPSNHLHNFEHATISMSFFLYAALAILFDRISPKAQYGLTLFLGAIAFAIELLLFHFHSTDLVGVEGQYHLLLQCVIVVSLTTTLIGIGLPKSFLVSFVRSLSIMFQGVWEIVMGFMLWTPELIFKGCFMHLEDSHYVVRCSSEEALHRAKSLANLQFTWFSIGISIFVVSLYLVLFKTYGEKVEYSSLTRNIETEEDSDDIKSQIKETKLGVCRSSIHVEKSFEPIDMES